RIEALLAPMADHVWLQGKRFGTVGAQVAGVPCEVTTYRAEVYRPDSRKPEVSFGDSIDQDLSRRDFTINAMALRLPDAVLVDPSAGLWFLSSTGLADHFLPELNQMELEQDPIHHHKDVLAHTIAVVAKTSPDLVLRLAALMHDVGKPKTRSFERGRATFHHH